MRVFRKTICIPFAAALHDVRLGIWSFGQRRADETCADAKNWAMPTGDYANTRYSKLNQINKDNVKNLQVKWTFSTGVLRGHEGGPLVIGDVMYVHTPFPNIVYALDLNNDGKILWKYEPKQDPNVIAIMCCDTVNRGVAYGDGKIILNQADTTVMALDAKTGKVAWSGQEWRATDGSKGESSTSAPDGRQGQGHHRHLRCRVSAFAAGISAYNLKDGTLAWRGLFDRPGCRNPDRSRKDDPSRQAGRPGLRHQHLGRRAVEDRRRHDLGLVRL